LGHALRRERLEERLRELGVDALLVTRLPNVRYLTGFTGSNGQLVVGANGSVFFTDGRYEHQSSREVPDVRREIYSETFAERASEWGRAAGVTRIGFEAAGLTYKGWSDLRDRVAGTFELVSTDGEVERLRVAKERSEIESIARAQACADEAFDRVVLGGGVREGVTERGLARLLEEAMRDAGADDLAFDPIVAFGEQAAEPHHSPTNRPLAPGDVVKLDFGAIVDGYHSDMTRTVALGEPRPELRTMHDLVTVAQRRAIETVRAGARLAVVDRAARGAIDDAGFGESFPHGLGHGVGLEIHEDPRLRWDADGELAEGAVVTIEPGVYVPGLGGVRIEDMVEVTSDGCRAMPRSTREMVVL
jgi:Xaa-Pro aminopeptidase